MEQLLHRQPDMDWKYLHLHDIKTIYPRDWLLRFSKVFYYEHGNLDLIEPTNRRSLVTILWRPYQEVLRKYSPDALETTYQNERNAYKKFKRLVSEQAGIDVIPLSQHQIKQIENPFRDPIVKATLTNYHDKVHRSLNLECKDVRILLQSKKDHHQGNFCIEEEIRMTIGLGMFRQKQYNMLRKQLFFICPQTKRLFTIFASAPEESFKEYRYLFDQIISNTFSVLNK
jgi:hypothetical protein